MSIPTAVVVAPSLSQEDGITESHLPHLAQGSQVYSESGIFLKFSRMYGKGEERTSRAFVVLLIYFGFAFFVLFCFFFIFVFVPVSLIYSLGACGSWCCICTDLSDVTFGHGLHQVSLQISDYLLTSS